MAVRIPTAFANEIQVDEGAEVEISVLRKRIVIAPTKRRYSLKELVRGITPENIHREPGWGKPRGKEVW